MRSRLTFLLLLAFFLLLAAILTFGYLTIQSDYCTRDLLAFWASAKQFFSGRNPYLIGEYTAELHPPHCIKECAYAVVEPPMGLVLSFPYYVLSFKEAIVGYLFSANLSFLFIIYFSRKLFQRNSSKSEAFQSFLPILTYTPLFISLYIGQIAIFITLAMTIFYYEFTRKNYFVSGLILSLTLSKPHLLYLLYFYILLKGLRLNSYRSCATGFISGTAILSVIACTVNPWIFAMNLDALLHIYEPGWLTPTVGSWLFQLHPALKKSWIAPMVLGVFVAWRISLRQNLNELLSIMTIVLWSMATTPYVWTYDFPIYIPTILLLGSGSILSQSRRIDSTKIILVLLGMNALLGFNRFQLHYDVWYPWLILLLWYSALKEGSIFEITDRPAVTEESI